MLGGHWSTSATPRATRREWIGLAVIALPCLLYSMDLTVLNLAVPHLSADLQPSAAQLLWIVDVYGFLVAGSLITMGTLGDRIGRRRLLMFGAAAFGAASVLAAFSTSAGMLIATRALLGVAGATLAPSTLSLIRNMFLDPHQRTVAIGVWVTSFSVGGAIGPLIGGVLLEYFWWGSVFLLGVPVMVLLLAHRAGVAPRVPGSGGRSPRPRERAPLARRRPAGDLRAQADGGARTGMAAGADGGRRARGGRRLRPPAAHPRPPADRPGALRHPRLRRVARHLHAGHLRGVRAYIFIAQYLHCATSHRPGRWPRCRPCSPSWLAPSWCRRPPGASTHSPHGRRAGAAAAGFGVLTQVDAAAECQCWWWSVIYSLECPRWSFWRPIVVGSAPVSGPAPPPSRDRLELGGALGIAILGNIGTAVYRTAMAGAGDELRRCPGHAGRRGRGGRPLPAEHGTGWCERPGTRSPRPSGHRGGLRADRCCWRSAP
jgi:DHA2 family multidrug resistance protein-like MFS transporter